MGGCALYSEQLCSNVPVRARACTCVRLRPSPSVSVRLRPSLSVSVRLRPSLSVSVRLRALLGCDDEANADSPSHNLRKCLPLRYSTYTLYEYVLYDIGYRIRWCVA